MNPAILIKFPRVPEELNKCNLDQQILDQPLDLRSFKQLTENEPQDRTAEHAAEQYT